MSLEAFRAAHCPPEEEKDASDETVSELEEDDEWLFAEERKRRAKNKERVKKPCKKHKRMEEIPDRVSSAKVDKLCQILETIRTNDPTEKVIVFSQVFQARPQLM